MLALGLALLCFQACLVPTVFGQIGCVRSPFDYAPSLWANVGEFGFPGYGYPEFNRGLFARRFELGYGAYGGEGVGEVSVAGELPADGATEVAGQVPILGAVEFAGPVKAAGTITISGTCGCGCGFLL